MSRLANITLVEIQNNTCTKNKILKRANLFELLLQFDATILIILDPHSRILISLVFNHDIVLHEQNFLYLITLEMIWHYVSEIVANNVTTEENLGASKVSLKKESLVIADYTSYFQIVDSHSYKYFKKNCDLVCHQQDMMNANKWWETRTSPLLFISYKLTITSID